MDTRESIIQVYEKILNGEQKSFSPYFFQPQHRKERLSVLIQYLIEEKLKLTPEEAVEKLNLNILKEYALDCVLRYIDKPVEFADDDVSHIVYFAYPNLKKPTNEELAIRVYKEVLAGKRKTFPKNYFLNGVIGEQRAITCFKYLCEEILKLDNEGIYKTFNGSQALKVLGEYKLKIIMNVLFVSTVDLLETAYPEKALFKKNPPQLTV